MFKKNLNQWAIFLTFTLIFCVFLGGCGRKGENEPDHLSIALHLPEGERPELFWFGVEKRSLSAWRNGVLLKEWPWSEGAQIDMNLEKLDQIQFRAYDRQERVIVEGSAPVTTEKKISIPLRRVL